MIGWLALLPLAAWLLWAAWFDPDQTDNEMVAAAAILGKVCGVVGSFAGAIVAAVWGGHTIGWW